MIKELEKAEDLISSEGGSEKSRIEAFNRLISITEVPIGVIDKLERIKKLDQKLGRLQIRAVRDLRATYSRVPVWERRFLTEEIDIQKKKSRIEEQLRLYEDRVRKYTANINNSIKFAMAYLKAHKFNDASKLIKATIQYLLELQAMLSDMEETENILLGLTEKELKDYEEEMKYA